MAGSQLQQHDLLPAAARRVVRSAGVGAAEVVLEAGAGRGRLTAALLATGCAVHAVELDQRRLAELRTGLAGPLAAGRLVLHAGDARSVQPALPPGWRAVANPPFRLGAVLVRRWLTAELAGGPPAAVDLLLQREAAARFTPVPGAWTRLGVLVALAGEAAVGTALRRDEVEPPSKVDLRLWSFRRRPWARSPVELALVDRLLAAAFAGPRSVRAALRGLATPAILARQAGTHRWDPAGPSRAVPPKAWLALAACLRDLGRL